MTKTRAVLTHLWPSLLVLALFAGLIIFFWYPFPYLQFEGSVKYSMLLVLAGGLIGPLLTFVVFKTDLRRLRIDLAVIVLIQVAAMAWGMHTLYVMRPYFMVFAVDRFEILALREVNLQGITDMRFLDKPARGPILLYATMPTDKQTYQRLLKEIMFDGKPDLPFRPQFWSLYKDRQQEALKRSHPVDWLRFSRPESIDAINELVMKHGGDINRLNFAPATGRGGDFAVILDAESGEIVDGLIIDPWIN